MRPSVRYRYTHTYCIYSQGREEAALCETARYGRDGCIAVIVHFMRDPPPVGYSTVAVNYVRTPPLKAADIPASVLASGGAGAGSGAASSAGDVPGVRVLSRLTLELSSFTQIGELRDTNELLKAFDIVAVVPGSEQILEAACKSGCVDVISLPAGSKLPFFIRKPHVCAGVAPLFSSIVLVPHVMQHH